MNDEILCSSEVKTCLITGAAGGVGKALVQIFKDNNFQVIATDLQNKPPSLYPEVKWVGIDLELFSNNQEYANSSVKKIEALLDGNPLNVLINNAAVQILDQADRITRNDWNQTLNVNVLAPFFLSQALFKHIELVQGCIVNIGSVHAKLTKKKFTAYAASKAALSSITRSLAIDWGGRVRVNTIEPAAISTEMLAASFSESPEALNKLAISHPLQRIGMPNEIARLALALASGEMDFINGASISIDGGISGVLHDPSSL